MNSQAAKTTTAEALLGLLSLGPMSGYEIRQLIERSIGNFWSESFGQIYPTLKKLQSAGLVTVANDGGPAKSAGRSSQRYELTPAGRQRLGTWLEVPARPQVPRNELLLKLFFGEHAAVSTMREQVRRTREIYEADLARYSEIVARMKTQSAQAGFPFWMMTVRYGMAEAEAMIAWANESLAALDEVETGNTEETQ